LVPCLLTIALAPAAGTPSAAVPRLDAHGDPLPEGALLRLGMVRLRHGENVTDLAFSADGKELQTFTLATANLRRWEAETGRSAGSLSLAVRPQGYGDAVFSPDGRWLVVCGAQPFVLFDTASGQPAAVAGRPCVSAAFGRDGGSLVTVSAEGVVRRQAVPDGELLAQCPLKLPGWARMAGSSAAGPGVAKS